MTSSGTAQSGLGRSVLLVLIGGWVIATILVGIEVLLTGRRIEQAISEAVARGGSVIVIDLPVSVLWWARPLLVLGLAVVAVAWAVTFVGKGFSGASSGLVVSLFGLAFVSLALCRAPVLDQWWRPANGQNVGSAAALHSFWAQDQRASALLVLLAAACGIALWVVALRRRTDTRTPAADAEAVR